MSRKNHIKILTSGVDKWNQWRKKKNNIRPELANISYFGDLSGANLFSANLNQANLRRTNLKDANLIDANLVDADLFGANLLNVNLNGANLKDANLVSADLKDANLQSAYLSGANLSNANLSNVNLRSTKLFGANLSGANFRSTNLRGANLSGTNLSNANLIGANLNQANLNEANLRGANLRGANLNQCILSNANLNNANLSKANLNNANLSNANLNNAKLSGADLIGANLRGAKLIGAKLIGANLRGANLSEANLTFVDFNSVTIGFTVFGLTDLSTCMGLETIIVENNCTIDFQTLRASNTPPRKFLLKLGLPELYIDYLPEFYMDALNFYPVFLSHSWANKPFARKLYDALITKQINVFFDEKKMKPGDDLYESISKGITYYDKMILVCSKESLEESWWVDREIDRILKKERDLHKEHRERINLLVPITIDQHIFTWNGAKAEEVRRYVIGDFTEWEDDEKFETALNELIQALNVNRLDIKPLSFL